MRIHYSNQNIVSVIFIIAVFTLTLPSLGFSELVLVDDYVLQPRQGEKIWFYNRLGGDRGIIGQEEQVEWGEGFVKATIGEGKTDAGVWTSLNHQNLEKIPLNFRKVLPDFILPEFQYAVNAIEIKLTDGIGKFKVELRDSDNHPLWDNSVQLSGGPNRLSFKLPETIENVQLLNWIIEGNQGDFVIVDEVFLEVSGPDLQDEKKFFLWSYAQLLANYDDETGLTRDRANWPAGDFDNVSATGMQAAAAVMAWHLGFISLDSAKSIVGQIKEAVINLGHTRYNGLLPHFVQRGVKHPDSEWSSVDTAICLIALIEACQALGISTEELEQMMKDINWENLIIPNVGISHGYDKNGVLIPDAWDIFGGETWLVNFTCAAALGKVAEILYPQPPTYNGSGFIDEIAWLLMPPPQYDRWHNDLPAYRLQASNHQLDYYSTVHPYSTYPINGLFGLSAAEVPIPSLVPVLKPKDPVYQAFGVGGKHGCQTIPPNDRASEPYPESPFMPAPVVIPHYAAMISSLHSDKAVGMFQWLEKPNLISWPEEYGLISPLNNVESLLIDEQENIYWNALKGSLNLAFTVLGFAEYLVGDSHPLYRAVEDNAFLSKAYRLMRSPLMDGPEWELVSSPGNVDEFAVINGTVFALIDAGKDTAELFKSGDIGMSWTPISIGLEIGYTLNDIDADLGVLYVACSNGVAYSEDEGVTWQWSLYWTWDSSEDVDFENGTGWVAIKNRGSRSGPNRKLPDEPWELRRGDLPWKCVFTYKVTVGRLDPQNVVYIDNSDNPSYHRTLNGGENWLPCDYSVIFTTVIDGKSVAFSNDKYTTDYGNTWRYSGISAQTFVKDEGTGFIFAANTDCGVYVGLPGCHWKPYGLPEKIRALAIASNYLLGASDSGEIFRVKISTDSLHWFGDVSGNGEITAFDASLVLQEVVGIITLPSTQYPCFTLKRADVSGNGAITAFDAALILQRSVGLINRFPVENQASPAIANRRSYNVTIPHLQAKQGEKLIVPVNIDDATGVLAGEITLAYESKILKPVKVKTTSLTTGYSLFYQETNNQLEISFAGVNPLNGSGSLVYVEFELNQSDFNNYPVGLTLPKVRLNESLQEIKKESLLNSLPSKTVLLPNYPNPFNPETWIPFRLAADVQVTITIYNAKGQSMRMLNLGWQPAGNYLTKSKSAHWDGRNDLGENVASGVYFYTLQAEDFTDTRRMLIVK